MKSCYFPDCQEPTAGFVPVTSAVKEPICELHWNQWISVPTTNPKKPYWEYWHEFWDWARSHVATLH